jgi:hypothetical protein
MKNQSIILVGRSFREVFRKPAYVVLFFFIALGFFLGVLLLTRHALLRIFDWPARIEVAWTLIINLHTTFTSSSIFLLISLAVLSAINISMMVFYMRRRIILQKRAGVGLVGIIIGFLGVGCASCGSLILSSIFGLSVTASFIGILPFKGLEFGILGIFFLLLSIYLVGKKIQDPLFCKISR